MSEIPRQETESPKENPAEVKTDIPPIPEETVVDTLPPTEADFSAKVVELEETLGIPLSEEAKNDIHKNMIGETTGGSNIENPTPTAEKEPHFPSLEEVIAQMKILIGQEDFKEERRKEGEDGIQLYEVSIIEKKPDGHEITHVYAYRKANGGGISTTSIDVAYCDGSPDDGNWLSGGYILSNYDEMTGEWRKASGIEDAKKEQAAAENISDPRQELLIEAARTIKTKLPPGGIRELPSEAAERYQTLLEMFDTAETVFGGTSLEKALEREAADFEAALKVREETKPLLNEISLLLIRLNKSEENYMSPLGQWNPEGDLTESQFNELNLRRKILTNAIGIVHKDASGKRTIEHDLNEI